MLRRLSRAGAIALSLALTLSLAGCTRRAAPPTVFHWWVGREAPVFDPDAAPEPVRASFERLLTRALVTEDSLGRPRLESVERVELSADRRRVTFHLKPGLRFVDGSRCSSAAFARALIEGAARTDHATRAWLLGAVEGAGPRPVRLQRPLAISAPDPLTLVLELSRPDSLLLRKLAAPGASAAWKSRAPGRTWSEAIGLGPYRVVRSDAREMKLARGDGTGPDTIAVRFAVGAPRARSVLRSGGADLIWPLPPDLLSQALPAGWSQRSREAAPPRRLSLVLRADVPPTTRLPARRALAHGLARSEVVRRVGPAGRELREWIPGAGVAGLPGLDPDAIRTWLDRGRFSRSFHVTLAYDADGAGAEIARALQGDWARYGIYVDLEPLRGARFVQEALKGQAQGLLIEEQGLIRGPVGILAAAVMPIRGPAVGTFRSGWRTREFDAWLAPRNLMPPLVSDYVERRMEEETIVIPLCQLDWLWLEREGGDPVGFHPRYGPFPAPAIARAEP